MREGATRKLHAVSKEGIGHVREMIGRGRPQPVAFPDKKAVGSNITCRDEVKNHKFSIEPGAGYKFSINQCESHIKSGLETI